MKQSPVRVLRERRSGLISGIMWPWTVLAKEAGQEGRQRSSIGWTAKSRDGMLGGFVMEARHVLIALLIAFGVAASAAVWTTIIRVSTTTSSLSHHATHI